MEINIIQSKIHEVRGYKVMPDYDLAEIYKVETKVLNQAIKRNTDGFPKDFMFRLTVKEWQAISLYDAKEAFTQATANRSQIVTSSQKHRAKSITPFAFTEHGVAMSASVLKSKKAATMNISIVRAFIASRQFAVSYDKLAKEITALKEITGSHNIQLTQIYEALENLMDEKTEQKKWSERKRIGFKPDK